MPKGQIRTPEEIAALRESGKMLATILELMRQECSAGKTPRQMSALAARELKKLGGEPAFLGHPGHINRFPDVMCISVNDQVQHSIPTDVPFNSGDVVNFDFGVKYQGMITDAGITVIVDKKSTAETERLVKGTERALQEGLKAVKHGCHVGDISSAIERVLRKHGLGIVKELVGHGVGRFLHEEPEIPNYGRPGTGPVLESGMTIAVEPITTLGNPLIKEGPDGWTLLTVDGSWAAQFEHTVLVTPSGCEILTQV